MSRLEHGGYVAWEEGTLPMFVVTDKGREWIEDGQPEIRYEMTCFGLAWIIEVLTASQTL